MNNLILYRRRIIPDECIFLKDDEILLCDKTVGKIVTRWHALHPKKDLHHGYSCYFLKEGYKISKFYRADNTLLYYYCDIIKPDYFPSEHKLIVTDLLADVIVYPNGFVKVVDLDELAPALDCGGITMEDLKQALCSLNALLTRIYAGEMTRLTEDITNLE